jgi:putative oxygen-independent coproporphyrinogen III oxidase
LKKFSPKETPLSLYIHLPWCEKQCPYCDFNIDINKKNGDEDLLIDAILSDLEASKIYISGRKFISIYFGGGTPSLVNSKNIEKILLKLSSSRMINKDCEISFEFNPKEVTLDYLTDLSNIGINRASIGIQSFDNVTLKSLERNHNADEALKALNIIDSIKSIKTSIDLIYGVMGQSLSSFVKDIEIFCSQNISHLSMYQLTIEPNTIFYKKELKIPKDTEIEKMEQAAQKLLNKSRFYQYEVSSWTKEKSFSKHNMNYWMYGDFLGLGPGAHSKITSEDEITRMVKLKKVDSYIKNPSKVAKNQITSDGYDIDLAMNLLRLKDGVSFDELKSRKIHLTETFLKKLNLGISNNLLEKNGIKATSIGYKFLNDTVNTFS